MCDNCGHPDCAGTGADAVKEIQKLATELVEAIDSDSDITVGEARDKFNIIIKRAGFALASILGVPPSIAIGIVAGEMMQTEQELAERASAELRENAQWN